ncbi:NAD+ synthase [Candidatus Woesearchaeota archaeon]|nr:NAD+ synthase [Candidatus Woesearchaeota archaeon]
MTLEHKIAIAQINPTVGDLIGNGRKVIEYIEKAKELGANIVIFPEQVITGYPAQDLLLHPDFIRDVMYVNDRITDHTEGITAIVGSVEAGKPKEGKLLYNVALVIKDGQIIAKKPKALLPNYDVFNELRYFIPASTVSPIAIDGINYGLQICEDMWDDDYSRKITKELIDKGAEVIINISASPFYVNKVSKRKELVEKHSKEHNIPFIYVNMVGAQDELIFDGNSMAIDGESFFQMPSFEESIQIIELNNSKLEILSKEEEVFKALTLGLKDYFRKNNLKKAILGLSGGIDSALTAVIAVEALGKENVKGILMPSKFSTSHSLEDALALVNNLGISHEIIPIKEMYDSAINGLEKTFGDKSFDVTEENIQARLRMMVLMSQVNKNGYTLLSTGDKSEIALGYCTLYGDMSGSISVISDLTKPEVYKVSKWYNLFKGKEIIPENTLTKLPSPELKPDQVAPFNYERLSPLLEKLTDRTSVRDLVREGYTINEIRGCYQRWRSAEFKRWQAPIALKCKPTSFGKGRMYPVTNNYLPRDLLD